MFIHHRSQGLIIKKEDRGEADQAFTIYTKEFGKLEILAKSIRKISSKLRPGAEIFYLSEIEFIQGKGRKTLTDAICLQRFNNLKQDLNRLKTAHLVAAAVDDFIKGQEADEKIWDLLIHVFKKINDPRLTVKELPSVYRHFLFNFISFLGYGINPESFKKLKSFSREYLSETLGVAR